VVPHFGDNKDVLTLDSPVALLEKVMDGITDLLLVLIVPGTIKMPVNPVLIS
jgi:hypothetical protein